MKHSTKLVAATLIVGAMFLSTAVEARVPQRTPSVDRREGRQRWRIKEGVNKGSLTKHETNQIVNQQKRIRAHERRAKADGTVTARERASLQRQEVRASRNIYRKKHNNRTR